MKPRNGSLTEANTLVGELIEAVFRRRGTVTRLTPDALLACWGAPRPEPDAVRLAAECALDLAALWNRSSIEGAGALRGLVHWGAALSGTFGGANRQDFAVLGPEVERSAKLSALVPSGAVAVSDAAYRELSTQVVGSWSSGAEEVRVFVTTALR